MDPTGCPWSWPTPWGLWRLDLSPMALAWGNQLKPFIIFILYKFWLNQAFFLYAEAKTQITENPRNSDNFSKLRSKVGKTQILRHIQVAQKDLHSPDICDSPDKLQKFKHFSTQIRIFSKLWSQFIQNSDQYLQNSDQNSKTQINFDSKLRSICPKLRYYDTLGAYGVMRGCTKIEPGSWTMSFSWFAQFHFS